MVEKERNNSLLCKKIVGEKLKYDLKVEEKKWTLSNPNISEIWVTLNSFVFSSNRAFSIFFLLAYCNMPSPVSFLKNNLAGTTLVLLNTISEPWGIKEGSVRKMLSFISPLLYISNFEESLFSNGYLAILSWGKL